MSLTKVSYSMINGAPVNVLDFGATGDGVTNDTAAIQAALNSGFGEVYIPDGTYMIDAVSNPLKPVDNQTLILSPQAILKAITTNSGGYSIILCESENVHIKGGVFEGDRATHTGTTGEFGHGISFRGAKNCSVSDALIKDCWGDGVYVGVNQTTSEKCENITVSKCIITNNRRNNISVTYADQVLIADCKITNANGTSPECGIDLEPNTGEEVTNVTITNCDISENVNQGILTYIAAGSIFKVYVDNCTIRANGNNGIHGGGSYLVISDCIITENGESGIWAQLYTGISISGCQIVDNCKTSTNSDLYLQGCLKSTIVNCLVKTDPLTAKAGVCYAENGQDLEISNCIFDGSNTTEQICGVYIKGNASSVKIGNCSIYNVGAHGVFTEDGIDALLISNTEIKNVSKKTNATFNYVVVDCNSVVVTGNILKTTAGNKPLYGIRIYGNNNIVTSNFIRDYQGTDAIKVESPSTGLISANNYTSAT